MKRSPLPVILTVAITLLFSILLLSLTAKIDGEKVLSQSKRVAFSNVQGAQTPTGVQPTPVGESTATPTVTPTASETPTPTLVPSPTPTPTALEGNAFVIGYSVAGRPIEVYRFGSGPTRRMVIAGIHGGYEYNTVELANLFIQHLSESPQTVPEEITLYVLPNFNPDGYARGFGYEGRANEHGVDLNRNWDSSWQADWPRAYCWDFLPIHGGTSAMSEPETQALGEFVLDQHIQALLSYHSAGPGIFGALAGGTASLSLANQLSAATGYPVAHSASLCKLTGMLVNWASDKGVMALDVELPIHADPDYETNLAGLEAFLTWKE